MKISYQKELRAKVKELKRPLVTIDVPGFAIQCLGDDQLVKTLIVAVTDYRQRSTLGGKREPVL